MDINEAKIRKVIKSVMNEGLLKSLVDAGPIKIKFVTNGFERPDSSAVDIYCMLGREISVSDIEKYVIKLDNVMDTFIPMLRNEDGFKYQLLQFKTIQSLQSGIKLFTRIRIFDTDTVKFIDVYKKYSVKL